VTWADRLARLKAAVWPDTEVADILDAATRVPDGSRRRFLRVALLGAAVAATVDVEQLLWTPKPIVLVPGGAFEDREFTITRVTPDWVVRESLSILEKNLAFSKHFSRHYELDDLRVGDRITLRVPKSRRRA
jgi:hypothetical protein